MTAPRGFVSDYNSVSMRDLNSDVFKASIEDLVNLWQTRFGNEWVDLETIENDNAYSLVCKRLRSLGQLEVHYLTDRARFVCRKPE